MDVANVVASFLYKFLAGRQFDVVRNFMDKVLSTTMPVSSPESSSIGKFALCFFQEKMLSNHVK